MRFRHLFLRLVASLLLVASTFLIGCGPSTPEERFQEAQQLIEERQLALAILKMRELINQEPDSAIIPDVRLTLASVYLNLGRQENLENAVAQFEAVVDQVGFEGAQMGSPVVRAAEAAIGVNLELGKVDEAKAFADEMVARTQGNPDLHERFRVARATINLRPDSDDEAERDEAIAAMQDIIVNGETAVRHEARELLALYHRREGDFLASNDVYDLYLGTEPEGEDRIVAEVLIGKALNLRQAEREEEAVELFQQGVMTLETLLEEELEIPARVDILRTLATYHTAFGEVDKAVDYRRRAMGEQPMTRGAIQDQTAIGDLYVRAGRFDEAIAHFQQMKAENPESAISQRADQYLAAIEQIRQQAAEPEAATQQQEPTPDAAPNGEQPEPPTP